MNHNKDETKMIARASLYSHIFLFCVVQYNIIVCMCVSSCSAVLFFTLFDGVGCCYILFHLMSFNHFFAVPFLNKFLVIFIPSYVQML